MRKNVYLFASVFVLALIVAGCNSAGKTGNAGESTVPLVKTEKRIEKITAGMIPQEIEYTTTYVRDNADAPWSFSKEEISGWNVPEHYKLLNSVWFIETDDARSVMPTLEERFSGKKGKFYIRFSDESKGISSSAGKDSAGTACMLLKIFTTFDIIIDCNGFQDYIMDLYFADSYVYKDGSVVLCYGRGGSFNGSIKVSADVKGSTFSDFLAALPATEEDLIMRSETYISYICFSDLPKFDVYSDDLIDYMWDPKITNTNDGENLSPELRWDVVEGASKYVVVMIDGKWLHMDVVTDKFSLESGAIGKNGPGNEYVGPYPPYGSLHTYSVFVFALKDDCEDYHMNFDTAGNDIDFIYLNLDKGKDGKKFNVLAYGRLDGHYVRYQ